MHCVSSSTNFSIQYVWISSYIFHDVLSRRSSYCHCRKCPHSSNLGQPSLIIPHFDWIPLINCLQVCFITVCSSAVSMLVVLSLPLAVRTMNTYCKSTRSCWWIALALIILFISDLVSLLVFSIDLFFRNNLKTSLLDSTYTLVIMVIQRAIGIQHFPYQVHDSRSEWLLAIRE